MHADSFSGLCGYFSKQLRTLPYSNDGIQYLSTSLVCLCLFKEVALEGPAYKNLEGSFSTLCSIVWNSRQPDEARIQILGFNNSTDSFDFDVHCVLGVCISLHLSENCSV